MTHLDATSWSLIERAAAGDPADRERFAQRYGPVVKSYFSARWRLPLDHDQVADASQEVFVQCFRKNGALDGVDAGAGPRFRSYLYGVARHVGSGIERQLSKNREVAAQSAIRLDNIEQSEVTLSRAFDRAWMRLIIREAGELASRRAGDDAFRCRALAALKLRFDDNLPPREIGSRLGVAVEDVYSLLRRAKGDFRAAFLEVMASYHPEDSAAELQEKCVSLVAEL